MGKIVLKSGKSERSKNDAYVVWDRLIQHKLTYFGFVAIGDTINKC